MMIAALMAMMMFTGCDYSLTDEQREAVKTELQIMDGVDGLSAYEVAVKGGFEDTEEEWMISLRGLAGVDGIDGLDGLSTYELWILADNEGTREDFLLSLIGEDGEDGICEACGIEEVEDEPIPEGMVLMTFRTERNITEVKVGRFFNGYLVSIEDVEVMEDNGTYMVDTNVTLYDFGHHEIGLSFDTVEPAEPEAEPK